MEDMEENQQLRRALQRLVDRLHEIHADSRYRSVWTIYQVHMGPYQGPDYVEELEAAEEVLLLYGEET